jgi:hypothetical protein
VPAQKGPLAGGRGLLAGEPFWGIALALLALPLAVRR